MPKIKLFVDAHVFDDIYQGTTTYISGIYNHLVNDNDFEITLGSYFPNELQNQFKDPRFKFVKYASKSKFYRIGFDIPSIIRKNKFDFAHFQYITPFRKECKYINTIHDLLFLDFPKYFPFNYRISKRTLFKYSAINSDLVCTVSQYSKRALENHFSIYDSYVTPNGINSPLKDIETIDVRSKYSVKDKYILYVSRFEPRKNHFLLLKSFVELELYKKGYNLVFIGKPNCISTNLYNTYYDNLSENIKNTVIQLENISSVELNDFYKHADLFVYPSIAEGFGIPPLEAAVNKCKVLCSNQTAMMDYDFFNSYMFNPYNETELKSKMIELINDSNYPASIIKDTVLDRYNWNIISKGFAEKVKSLY